MSKCTIEFPNDKARDRFVSWLSSQGEQIFFDWEEIQNEDTPNDAINVMDYAKAFEAWGYNPAIDGEPMVMAKIVREEGE